MVAEGKLDGATDGAPQAETTLGTRAARKAPSLSKIDPTASLEPR